MKLSNGEIAELSNGEIADLSKEVLLSLNGKQLDDFDKITVLKAAAILIESKIQSQIFQTSINETLNKIKNSMYPIHTKGSVKNEKKNIH